MTRTQRQRLENIRTPSNPTINGNRDPTSRDRNTLSQGVKGRGYTVELAPTVVGDDDSVDAELDG